MPAGIVNITTTPLCFSIISMFKYHIVILILFVVALMVAEYISFLISVVLVVVVIVAVSVAVAVSTAILRNLLIILSRRFCNLFSISRFSFHIKYSQSDIM